MQQENNDDLRAMSGYYGDTVDFTEVVVTNEPVTLEESLLTLEGFNNYLHTPLVWRLG